MNISSLKVMYRDSWTRIGSDQEADEKAWTLTYSK